MTAEKQNETVRKSALRNTLKCVLVLGVIAVVCVALLAVANKFLQIKIELDRATSDLINQIAPTGVDNDKAFSDKRIRMVDLGAGKYAVTDLDAYNKEYGTVNNKVRALYESEDASGNVTLVVEAEGKGYVDAIVMLVAYDTEGKVSGLVTKSQNESYWSHIADEQKLYAAFVGTAGSVDQSKIAAETGVTVRGTLGGMTSAVSIANGFAARLGGESQAPVREEDAAKLLLLRKVSDATEFTRYTVGTAKVEFAYIGDNGDRIVQAKSAESGYGDVTLLVRVKDGKADRLAYVQENFRPVEGHDSAPLQSDEALGALFGGKTAAEIAALNPENLAGNTGVTQSASGLKSAVLNALSYEFTQEGA